MRLRTTIGATFLAVAWVATRAAMVVVLVHEHLAAAGHDWLPTSVTDDVTRDYFLAASRMAHGAIPYAGFHYEYPPGSLPFLALAHAISGDDPGRFLYLWIATMVVLDLVVLGLIARRCGWRTPAAAFWVLALPALGPMALARNDLITLAAIVGAVALLARHRPMLAGALLGFAVLTKVWPVVLIGLLVLLIRRRDAIRLVVGAAAVVAAAAITLAGLGALGPMLDTLTSFHTARPLEIESSWAVALLAIAAVGGHAIHPVYTYLSFNVPPERAHGLAPVAYRASYAIEGLGLLVAAVVRMRRPRVVDDTLPWWLGLAVVAGGLAVAPVFSPQYMLWLDAVVVALLVYDRSRAAVAAAALTVAIGVLSQTEYPFLFPSLHASAPAGITVTGVRDFGVVALAALASVAVVRQVRRG